MSVTTKHIVSELDGYLETGVNLGDPGASYQLPLDGRVYETTTARTFSLTLGTAPTVPVCASTVLIVIGGSTISSFPAGIYWAGGAEIAVDASGVTRYVFSTTPAGKILADAEVLTVP